MKDLFRCLDEYPLEMIQALAEAWDVALPRDEPLQSVVRLGEAMLRSGALEESVQAVSAPARDALAEVVASGGAMAARVLALSYGEVRRFGPAGLRREQPWRAPASPLEELYYRGLLYRAFGDLGDYIGELLVIPDQLLEHMPALTHITIADNLAEGGLRGAATVCGEALMEDLMAVVVRLRQQAIRLPANPTPSSTLLDRLDLGARLRGPALPARLHLMWRLLLSQGLAEHDGRQWRLSLRTRQWLGQPDAEQWQACFVAWRDDRGWDELRDLPSLLCDPGGCPNEPWLARKRLCRILEQIPEDRWWDLGSFLAALRKHHPNYLRPDGDMDSWFVREASSGAFLRGPEHWDAIEGALAHHLIVGPLHWLGVIDLGEGDPDPGDDTGRTFFRISGAGKDLLTELPPHLADARPGEPLATVDTRLRVTIRVRDSRYQRYQLERLAQWEGQDGVARYWLSEDAVWQAQNSGVTADQILAFLRRITKDRVPEIVVQTLRAWGRRFGGATLKRAVILETDDTSMMKRIRQMPGISNLLGQELGPTRCIVSEENMDRVVAELKKQNIWPRIEH